ncbi:MAG: RDD family protein [Oscillospiraceae bacterium]|nr:RDD family protein [Oscillospiraceae bacterium]
MHPEDNRTPDELREQAVPETVGSAEQPQSAEKEPLPFSQRPYEYYEEPDWLKNKKTRTPDKMPVQGAASVGIVGVKPAGLFVRGIALLLDLVFCTPLFWLCCRACAALSLNALAAALLCLGCFTLYCVLCQWAFGATLGKGLLGLRLISTQTGGDATLWQCLFRETAGKLLSVWLVIGLFVSAFRADSRALHDLLADTAVVHR